MWLPRNGAAATFWCCRQEMLLLLLLLQPPPPPAPSCKEVSALRPANNRLPACLLPLRPLQIINPGATLIQVLEWTLLNSAVGKRL